MLRKTKEQGIMQTIGFFITHFFFAFSKKVVNY